MSKCAENLDLAIYNAIPRDAKLPDIGIKGRKTDATKKEIAGKTGDEIGATENRTMGPS